MQPPDPDAPAQPDPYAATEPADALTPAEMSAIPTTLPATIPARQVDDDSSDASPDEPPPPRDQPADSTITFIPAPDSLTFAIPHTGFRGTALFFLIFALIWDGITFPVATVFIVEFIQQPNFFNFLPLVFLSLFAAIGILMALAAVQFAFRKAVMVAARDSLVYTQKGPLRNREFQWKSAELASIITDYSGTQINNRRLRELRIITKDGTKKGFFDGRDDVELAWLAGTLREFYQLKK